MRRKFSLISDGFACARADAVSPRKLHSHNGRRGQRALDASRIARRALRRRAARRAGPRRTEPLAAGRSARGAVADQRSTAPGHQHQPVRATRPAVLILLRKLAAIPRASRRVNRQERTILRMGCSAREWQVEVEALKRSRDDLQRASLQVAEEVRAIRTQSDRQNSEFSALGSELRARAQTLEDSFRQQVCLTADCQHMPSLLQLFAPSSNLCYCLQLEAVRRAAAEGQVRSSSTSLADAAVSGVRQQVELRAGELHDALSQLRTRVELAEQERRAAEQQVASRCATGSSLSPFSQSPPGPLPLKNASASPLFSSPLFAIRVARRRRAPVDHH